MAKTDPDFIPQVQDMATLCRNLCTSPNTVDKWVAEGIIPPPRMIGGKKYWLWDKVREYLFPDVDRPPVDEAERMDADAKRIRENVRRDLHRH